MCRARLIGALWGWAQVALARNATQTLVRGTALVLSPHPDDETIGCGLLLAEMARSGHSTCVALATDGGGGWYSAAPRPTPESIVQIRQGEWHRALDALNVPKEGRFEFGFPDGTLSDREGEVAERIGDLLRSLSPSEVLVTKPSDSHPDHRALARATRQAMIDVYGSSHVPVSEGAQGGNRSRPRRRFAARGLHLPGLPSGRSVARRSPAPGNPGHDAPAARSVGHSASSVGVH